MSTMYTANQRFALLAISKTIFVTCVSDLVIKLLNENRFSFDYTNLEAKAPRVAGIYSFWYDHTPIYVGKAQSIYQRLMSYYRANPRNSAENKSLLSWIMCYRTDRKFCVRTLSLANLTEQKILEREKYYIQQISPISNIIHNN